MHCSQHWDGRKEGTRGSLAGVPQTACEFQASEQSCFKRQGWWPWGTDTLSYTSPHPTPTHSPLTSLEDHDYSIIESLDSTGIWYNKWFCENIKESMIRFSNASLKTNKQEHGQRSDFHQEKQFNRQCYTYHFLRPWSRRTVHTVCRWQIYHGVCQLYNSRLEGNIHPLWTLIPWGCYPLSEGIQK